MHIFLVFSFFLCTFAPLNGENCCCSSVVEHFLGKEEVTSSSLVNSSEKEEPGLFLFCIRTSSNPLLRNHPFFISAERPEDRQGTGGADGSGPPAAEMPNAKDAGRGGAWLPRRQMRRCTLGSAGRRDAAFHAEVSGRAAASGRRKATKQTIRSPIAAQSANTAPKMDYPSRSFAVTLPCK